MVYDIRDDKRRNKIFQTLKDFGVPVQYSAFECKVRSEDYVRLRHLLRQHMNASEDSIVFYRQCAACAAKAQRIGDSRDPFESDIVII